MSSWLSTAARLAAAVEGGVERVVEEAQEWRGPPLPPRVVAYRGYGAAHHVLVLGRVLRDTAIPPASRDASRWENLLAAYRRFDTAVVAGARLRVGTGADAREVVADEEGYFRCELPLGAPSAASGAWQSASVELLAPREEGGTATVLAPVLVPGPAARFGVISDIDDTVVQTGATELLRMARTVFLGNARTRLPFPGVAAFYRALQAGADGGSGNPLFYVSSSPWNLYELLVEFFEIEGVPLGPLLLRDWDITPRGLLAPRHAPHKLDGIRRILATYPQLRFILIGDSGQEDPEIYAQVIREFPHRVLAAYIRNVSGTTPRLDAVRALAAEMEKDQAPLLLTDDTLAAARDAAERGWITANAVTRVSLDSDRDKGTASAWRS